MKPAPAIGVTGTGCLSVVPIPQHFAHSADAPCRYPHRGNRRSDQSAIGIAQVEGVWRNLGLLDQHRAGAVGFRRVFREPDGIRVHALVNKADGHYAYSASRSTTSAVPRSKWSSMSCATCSMSSTIPKRIAVARDGVNATSPVRGSECTNPNVIAD